MQQSHNARSPIVFDAEITNEAFSGYRALSAQTVASYKMLGRNAPDDAFPLAPLLASLNDPLLKAGALIKPIPGYTDVIVHGQKDGFAWLLDASAPQLQKSWLFLNQRTLANYVKSSGYNGGSIRLISCNTGACDAVAAQNFANKMNVEVLAPTDTVWIHPSGRLSVGETQYFNTGEWVSFFPKRPWE
ncbi:hypothetical protein [Chitinimonas lacunae]|uniref:Uncharacterized protein n=1 Tax=Chitinimonas lacunae TaxID=1963018 RepID=A0ABV8MIK0_9NEIS